MSETAQPPEQTERELKQAQAQARASVRSMQLGDARSGKLSDNLTAFGRALRRAGLPVDAARIALAQEALLLTGVASKADVSAALEAVFVSREQDRIVFRELFDLFFRDPELARKLLAQMLPTAPSAPTKPKERARVREAMQPKQATEPKTAEEKEMEFDAAMTASRMQRLKTADFNELTASEYHLVEQLVRDIPLPMPTVAARRTQAGSRGARIHWSRTMRAAASHGGDVFDLRRLRRKRQVLPLLLLVDVSGSMERYTRLLLAFLHAATRWSHRNGRRTLVPRNVYAFGTRLTDLTDLFQLADTDTMLLRAGVRITDYAGGTRLGDALQVLHKEHGRCLIGGRTLVMIISDGLDTGEPDVLQRELQWLKHHSRRLLWLNPLLRFDGYAPTARGAAVLHAAADAMLAVHNIQHLQELADAISCLINQ